MNMDVERFATLENPCETCKGTGKLIEYSQEMDEGGHVTEASSETGCSQCNGTGKVTVKW